MRTGGLVLVAVVALGAAGCRPDPCAGVAADRQCFAVEVRAVAGVPNPLDQLRISLRAGTVMLDAARGESVKLPALVGLVPPQAISFFELTIVGVKDGSAVASHTVSADVGSDTRPAVKILLEAGGEGDGGAPPDLAPAPTDLKSVPCQVVQQTGCGAQKCTVDISNGNVLCAPNGTQIVGGACGTPGTLPEPATDPCGKGLLCINVGPDGVFNMCRQFCASGADCTQTPRVSAGNPPRCLLELTNGKSTVCTVSCDPTATTDCPSGTTCRLKRAGIVPDYTDCEGDRGIQTDGQPCTDGCADTLSCVNGRCRKVCIQAAPACGGGQTCQAPFGGPVFGFCCPAGGC